MLHLLYVEKKKMQQIRQGELSGSQSPHSSNEPYESKGSEGG
jgi:hypothetical protein